MINGHDEVAVFLGLDVGKGAHHAVALNRPGKCLLDRALPNDEVKLRELYRRLAAHGPVLLVVDQPATIGALPVAVALDEGSAVAYLPGLAMRRIADLHPGSAKTDARDAAVIAAAARSMPHTLRVLKLDDETIAELTVLSGFDDDLAGQITATSNRIRGLLTQIHPALERALGPRLDHPAVLDLIETWPTPAALTAAGKTKVRSRLLNRAPRLGGRLTEDIFAALAAQTVIVTGTNAAGVVLPRLATQLAAPAPAADEGCRTGRGPGGGAPSFHGPDHHARCRGQDRRTTAHRGCRQRLPDRRAPGFLRRAGAGHPQIRLFDPRGTPTPRWQQDPQTSHVPVRVRGAARPRLARLLRPQDRPGQTPQ